MARQYALLDGELSSLVGKLAGDFEPPGEIPIAKHNEIDSTRLTRYRVKCPRSIAIQQVGLRLDSLIGVSPRKNPPRRTFPEETGTLLWDRRTL